MSTMPNSTPPSAFDARLVELDIILPTQTLTFSGDYAIFANGQKFFSTNAAMCEARIFNLTASQRNQIISLASPLRQPRVPIYMNLKVGRVSTGLFLLYSGQVILADVLQPPDIGIVLRSLANNFLTGQIENVNYAANTPLSQIAKGEAARAGWSLNNQASEKNISNFSYTGCPQDGLDKLNEIGNVQACVDTTLPNGTLIITDADKAVTGAPYLLNSNTGMVGIPQVTDQGVIVKMMVNNAIQIGGSVTVDSTTNPAAKGTYKIMQIEYEIASRDKPFWYTLVCSNLGVYNGTQ